MNRRFALPLALATSWVATTPALAAPAQNQPRIESAAPREITSSTSAVPGDRVVCLYDKPSRKMICRTFDQWRVIGIQRSAKRNFEKDADNR